MVEITTRIGKHGSRLVIIKHKTSHIRPYMDRSNRLLRTHLIEKQNENTFNVRRELILRN